MLWANKDLLKLFLRHGKETLVLFSPVIVLYPSKRDTFCDIGKNESCQIKMKQYLI